MATSLICEQCKALLANVAEAQAHNEATGHTQFAESTQQVTRLVCTECGKACRNDAEKTLHTKFTGHATYVDRTGQEPEALDTEAQMAEARAAAAEDAEADVELLGLKRKKAAPPAGAGAEGEAGSSGAAADEMVPPEVDEALLKDLEEMGFPHDRAVRALHLSGGTGVEGAINWLTDHEGDGDIDTPLLVPKSTAAKKEPLSAEEARLKAEELMRRARQKREREEKAAEVLRERERIRMGKEIQEAQRKEEAQKMKRIVEERQREKEEEARARDRLRQKLEEDRRERRRKLGLPEELTEEEKARDAEKARKKAEEEAKRRHTFIKPVSVLDKLRASLVAMKKAAPSDEAFKTGATTLLKYIGNVARSPGEEKFRRINIANAAFQTRVAALPGGVDVLEAVGFQKVEGQEALVMSAEIASDAERLNLAGAAINDALSNPFFGAL